MIGTGRLPVSEFVRALQTTFPNSTKANFAPQKEIGATTDRACGTAPQKRLKNERRTFVLKDTLQVKAKNRNEACEGLNPNLGIIPSMASSLFSTLLQFQENSYVAGDIQKIYFSLGKEIQTDLDAFSS